MDKLNERKLLEALVGYGEWGDRDFPDDHNFHQDLIETLGYKVSLLEEIYNKGEEVSGNHPLMRYLFDLGDVMNFLCEFKKQLGDKTSMYLEIIPFDGKYCVGKKLKDGLFKRFSAWFDTNDEAYKWRREVYDVVSGELQDAANEFKENAYEMASKFLDAKYDL